ncbi:hypothetical protein ABEV55_08525 [Aneurinibacillus thermoaerophilus]|uniref:hypothetical protein n=1 Tax=Aneurinibacillus thermoaerophilus TaxID=143495 RepID=UPI002E24C379|nr:hypothetical protein [Aneurinibacillus thermoaerophilus]
MYDKIDPEIIVPLATPDGIKAIILGVKSIRPKEVTRLRRSLSRMNVPLLMMPVKEAQVVKNVYCFYRLGLLQETELYQHCQEHGADFIMVRRALGLDPAIGQTREQENGELILNWLLKTASLFFAFRIERDFNKKSVGNVSLGVWGNAETPFVYEAVTSLHFLGADIHLFSMHDEDKDDMKFPCILYQDKWRALQGVDALIILEKQQAFVSIPVKEWYIRRSLMKQNIVIDVCNLYEPEEMEQIGYQYISFGRFCV